MQTSLEKVAWYAHGMATGASFGVLRCGVGVSAILGVVSACGGAVRSGGDGNGGAGGTTSTGGATSAGGAASAGGSKSAGGASAAGGSTAIGGSGATRTTLNASDFDQWCEHISDCFVVHDGEQCACNQCPDAAINLRESDRWSAAHVGFSCRLACDPAACEPKAYVCSDHRCVVTDPPTIVADDFDQKCRGDDDCAMIPTGQLCDSCATCGSAGAVSKAGREAWAAVMDGIACAAFGLECPCDPPPPRPAVCVIPSGSDTGTCRPWGDAPGPRVAQYADDYDRRCEDGTDCKLVVQGPRCCLQCADYAAIAMAAVSTWDSDLTEIECPAGAPAMPCPGAAMDPNGCSTFMPHAACVNGRCEAFLHTPTM